MTNDGGLLVVRATDPRCYIGDLSTAGFRKVAYVSMGLIVADTSSLVFPYLGLCLLCPKIRKTNVTIETIEWSNKEIR